jgi:hypothetical protein
MPAEARKYGLSLSLAHQYLGQLQEDIQAAIFGNVGTLIAFRVGAAPKDKDCILYNLDAVLRDVKTRQAYSSTK